MMIQTYKKNYKNSTLTHRPHNTKISRPLDSVRSYFIKRVIKIPIVAPAPLFVVCEVNILFFFDSSELLLLAWRTVRISVRRI